ncbi:MAG: hypothetical protein DRG39_08160, partial [Deltaproteobacteria bacterium]
MREREKVFLVVGLLFVIALVVRGVAILQTPVIAKDSILYIKSAKLYYSGNYEEAFKVYPYSLLPMLIAPFYKIFNNWVKAGQWLSALCGSLTVIPLYLLAKRLFHQKVAIWTAIFYICCPDLVRYSAEILKDIPFIFFYT